MRYKDAEYHDQGAFNIQPDRVDVRHKLSFSRTRL